MKEMISKQICSSGLSRFVPLNKGALQNTERCVLNGGQSVRSVPSFPSRLVQQGRMRFGCLSEDAAAAAAAGRLLLSGQEASGSSQADSLRDETGQATSRLQMGAVQRSGAPRWAWNNQAVTMVTFLKPAPWGDGIRLCVYFNPKVLK